MREPSFWWREATMAARLLAPAAATYGAVAKARLAQPGRRAGVPVVCIGNLTTGGAGKTPTALAVAHILTAAGERPAFLSRGYGGREAGPLEVDPERNRAIEVGDEPLLLARTAPTIVARARVQGARLAVRAGASVIVMDDGFQNPALAKDFAVLVVDGRRGIGNGRVIPAGPLRAPLAVQLRHADALLVIGQGGGGASVVAAAKELELPVFAARLEPDAGVLAMLGGRRVLAFAGIGDPDKFFTTLADAGISVVAKRSFGDHHRYTQAEGSRLCEEARHGRLVLVTTEKDLVRLSREDGTAELAARAHALPVRLAIEDQDAFRRLLLARLAQSGNG
jgi:tetraacyldisaccharide 4'-kinase